MANKKISELQSRTPALSDLMLVGDPSSGYSYKCTVTALATIIETDIADGYVTIGTTQTISGAKTFSNNLTLTSVVNTPTDPDKFLTLNASNVITYRTGAEVLSDIGGVGGSGTTNYLPKFSATTTLANSQIFDNGTNIGIATATPDATARVQIDKTDGYGLYLNYNTSAGSGITTTALYAINTTASSGYAAVIEEKTPNTTAGQYPFVIKHSLSSGTAGVGFGTGVHFQLLDDAGTSKTTQLTIENIDAAAATYKTRYRFNVQNNGSSTPVVYINGTGLGVFTASPSVALDVTGEGKFSTINNATTDTDRFLVSDSGVIKYRTGSEVLSDIGAASSSSISGTTNYIPKFTSSSAIGNSVVYDDGSNIGINTTTPANRLDVNGNMRVYNVAAGSTIVNITSANTGTSTINFGGTTTNNKGRIVHNDNDASLSFFTNSSERMRLDASGNLGLGTTSLNNTNFYVARSITGGVNGYGILHEGAVQSDVTSSAFYFRTTAGTQAASFTLSNLYHFHAQSTAFGASSAVTNQYGFSVQSNLTGATNNYGFYGNIASGTGRWNLYMNGTADNYLAGSLGIGTNSITSRLTVQSTVGSVASFNSTDANGGYVRFQRSGTDIGFIGSAYHIISPAGANTDIAVSSSGAVIFGTGASLNERMRITSAGNIGIGTSTPDGKLHVLNGSAGTVTANANADDLVVENSSTGGLSILTPDINTGYIIFGSPSDNEGAIIRYNQSGALMTIGTELAGGQLSFRTGAGTERMRLDASGNLGLGVTPSAWSTSYKAFQLNTQPAIWGATDALFISVNQFQNTSGSNRYIANGFATQYRQDGGQHQWYTAPSGVAGNSISFTQAMTLDASGRLGLGTTDIEETMTVARVGGGDGIIAGFRSDASFSQFTLSTANSQVDFGFNVVGNRNMFFSTNSTERMRITSDGSVGIGSTSLTGYNLRVEKNLTGSTTSTGIASFGQIQSDATANARYFSSQASQAAGFTTTNIQHYHATQGTLSGTVTNQIAFNVASTLTGGASNFAFKSDLDAGTNRWNLYMNGTANNYLAGSLGIGTTSLTGYGLRVLKSITGATTSLGIVSDGAIQADVTNTAAYFRSVASASATPFALTDLAHFQATTGSLGSASITSQYGFLVASSMTGASNNFAFYGNLAAATGRWNLYMNGTADNYLAGKLAIGTTSPSASALLDVSSTTQGFLPPRMTGAQAEAIATPAAGLMIYANNGNGTTITSTGWWGYDGTTWVKLN